MPNQMTNVRRPFSLLHHSQVNNLDPRRVLLNAPNLFSSFYFRRHEFDAAIESAYWSTDVTAGGGPTAFAYNAQRNGALRGATGTTDNDVTAIYGAQVQYDSGDNPSMFWRLRAPAAVTGFAFELLWSDAKTDEKLVCVSALSAAGAPTIANGITDFAGVVLNTDLTLTTAALIGDGTTGTVQGTPIGTYTPTASKIVDIVLSISPNLCKVSIWDDGAHVGDYGLTNGPDTAVLVRPSFIAKTLDTTTKVWDILKVVILAEENAS